MHSNGKTITSFVDTKSSKGSKVGWDQYKSEPVSIYRFKDGVSASGPDKTAQHWGTISSIPLWKRTIDICIILFLFPAVALIFLLCSVYIKMFSRGPVFFRQERIGYRGKAFCIYKFRTMHVNTGQDIHRDHLIKLMNENAPMTKLDNVGDKRLIPFAGILRASGIDELPQLINVLRGEMSIIGPRPCTPYEYQMYQPHHKLRLFALPGLTGLWQVSGKNSTTFEQMVALDVQYVKSQSIALDFKIIAKTFPVLFGQVKAQMQARLAKRPTGKYEISQAERNLQNNRY